MSHSQEPSHAADTKDTETKRLVPVLTVCGWLGAGKTTLLEHLIKSQSVMRIGVLVNDMAAVNVDANTLARVVHAKDEMIEFSNGTVSPCYQVFHPTVTV